MYDHYSDIFLRRGAQYTDAMHRCPAARQAEFDQLLESADVEPGHRLLDMPAGGAYLRDFLRVPGVHYSALETTDGFLTHLAQAERPPLVLVPSLDAVPLPLPTGCADRIVSLAGLHHIQDRAAVYAEMRRLLVPGGVACVADVQVGTTTALFLNGPVDQFCPLGHRGVFLDESDTGWLAQAGLRVMDDRLVDVPWRFASLAEMGAFCSLLFGLDNAPDDNAVIDAIVAGPGVSHCDDQVLMHWPLRFVRVVAD